MPYLARYFHSLLLSFYDLKAGIGGVIRHFPDAAGQILVFSLKTLHFLLIRGIRYN
jgi:hypothetical protein